VTSSAPPEDRFGVWSGLPGGLLRALGARDPGAPRHALAVARFACEITRAIGKSDAEVRLAEIAGLLHDIGHLALSDHLHERNGPLTDADWKAIKRHPQLGADLLDELRAETLRELSGGRLGTLAADAPERPRKVGPIARVVLTHHERVDGRGYPNGLLADRIPEISKIVSVAEVYDTLTGSDTYRSPISSFAALRELRRVAGTQLDAYYVEVLAGLIKDGAYLLS
jgi:putative nucleotidyltransferase with HDIG domain